MTARARGAAGQPRRPARYGERNTNAKGKKMKISLWHGTNNESWRERFTDISDDAEQQLLADDLRTAVVNRLADAGHEVVVAHEQRIGMLVICQTPDADEIVEAAIETCEFELRCNR